MTGIRNWGPVEWYGHSILETIMPDAAWAFPVPYASNPAKATYYVTIWERTDEDIQIPRNTVLKVSRPASLVENGADPFRAREEIRHEAEVLADLKSAIKDRSDKLEEKLSINIPSMYVSIGEDHYTSIEERVSERVREGHIPESVLDDLATLEPAGFIRESQDGRFVQHIEDLTPAYVERLADDIELLHEWGYAGWSLLGLERDANGIPRLDRVPINEKGQIRTNLVRLQSPHTGLVSYHPTEFSVLKTDEEQGFSELQAIDKNQLNSLVGIAEQYSNGLNGSS